MSSPTYNMVALQRSGVVKRFETTVPCYPIEGGFLHSFKLRTVKNCRRQSTLEGMLAVASTGTLNLSAGATLAIAASGSMTTGTTAGLEGEIANEGTLTFDLDADRTFAGEFSGSGSFVKNGFGTLVLTGTLGLTGRFDVLGGRLLVNGAMDGDARVTGGATLAGNMSVGDLDVQGGTVAPGNSIGTIVVDGDYIHYAGATYEVEINDAGESDLIDVSGSATINGGTVDVQPEPGTYTHGMRCTILEADGGVTGRFDALSERIAGVSFSRPSSSTGSVSNAACAATLTAGPSIPHSSSWCTM